MILGLLAHLAVAATLAAPAAVERPARAVAQGQLRSAGERTPVAGARVIATALRGLQWQRSAVSGPDGRFILEDLPSHDFVLTIVAAGHQRLEQPTPPSFWRRRKPPVIYLQPAGAGGYRTIVQQERVSRPSATSTRLSPEEIGNLPGSQGDPLRALQNLPGVARVPGGLGLLILRGAAPNQSQVFFGEHPLPRAFHVPGLASVVQPGVLESLEYVPGNFSAHYGNAVGGLVHLAPRVGRRDGVHGHAKLDITSAGALIEGPFGKGGSVLLAAQTGYIDAAIRALPDDAVAGNTLAPHYHDYQFIIDHPAGRGGNITARLLGARDTLNILWDGINREVFSSMQNGFHRVDLAYRKRHGPWDFLLAPAVRLDRTLNDMETYQRRRGDVVGLLRAEASVRPVKPLHITLGLDTQLDRYTTQLKISYMEAPVDESGRGLLTTTGLYLSSQLDVGRFALIAGARFNAFTGVENHALAFDPRVLLRYTPHPRVRIQLAAGLYSQPGLRRSIVSAGFISTDTTSPTSSSLLFPGLVLPGALRFLDPQLEFEPTGPVGVTRATQYSANLHLDLTDSLDLEATLFYRRIRDGFTPVPPETAIPGGTDPQPPESFAIATGSATHGVEVMLRHDLTARLYGWLAYTWMRSTASATFADHILRRPADFDQRHNLVMLVGYKLPRRWSIAARFRLVTGLPYTPYVGGLEDQGGYVLPIIGAPNSARMPVFHQLDLRIDRTWILHRCIVAAYLDVQNLYNRQNAEGVLYSANYASTRAVVGLPILPILGFKVSF